MASSLHSTAWDTITSLGFSLKGFANRIIYLIGNNNKNLYNFVMRKNYGMAGIYFWANDRQILFTSTAAVVGISPYVIPPNNFLKVISPPVCTTGRSCIYALALNDIYNYVSQN